MIGLSSTAVKIGAACALVGIAEICYDIPSTLLEEASLVDRLMDPATFFEEAFLIALSAPEGLNDEFFFRISTRSDLSYSQFLETVSHISDEKMKNIARLYRQYSVAKRVNISVEQALDPEDHQILNKNLKGRALHNIVLRKDVSIDEALELIGPIADGIEKDDLLLQVASKIQSWKDAFKVSQAMSICFYKDLPIIVAMRKFTIPSNLRNHPIILMYMSSFDPRTLENGIGCDVPLFRVKSDTDA